MHDRTRTPKEALLPLINDLCERIRAVEPEQGLWAGPNDFRPRIELFHDAIRALVAGHSPYEAKGRLTLERLAWDIDTLRAIQENPLLKLPGTERLSPSTAVAIRRSAGDQKHYQRGLRSEMQELYKNYTVLFVAMLAETADMNHKARMEEQDMLVEALACVERGVKGKTSANLHKVADAQINDPIMRDDVKALLPKGTLEAADAIKALKNTHVKIDKLQAQLEKCHLGWLTGQLAMYEESREVVQQFMRAGLNLAGKFVQETMQQGGRGSSRGF
jgi:hypothetical protein